MVMVVVRVAVRVAMFGKARGCGGDKGVMGGCDILRSEKYRAVPMHGVQAARTSSSPFMMRTVLQRVAHGQACEMYRW